MGRKAELIEQFMTTFGIEVEFCSIETEYTKDNHRPLKMISDCLSYTHIEVCTFKDGNHPNPWKIETDSEYTLELVSPILKFDDHKKANNFKQKLIKELDAITQNKLLLKDCVYKIQKAIKKLANDEKFLYYDPDTGNNDDPDTGNNEQPINNFIEYITKEKLVRELNYHNWDDTTNLKDLNNAIEIVNKLEDSEFQSILKTLQVKSSQKHEGIPSSQLNLPMSLKAYVWYSVYVKEPTIWRKLLLSSKEDFKKQWKNTRKTRVSCLRGKKVESKEDVELNEYFDGIFENKKGYWQTYWFWLVSIRELAEAAFKNSVNQDKNSEHRDWIQILSDMKEDKKKSSKFLDELKFDEFEKTTGIVNKGRFRGLPKDIQRKSDGSLPIDEHWTITKKENRVIFSLLYLIVQKLIAGTLGSLSETVQLELQKKIQEKGEIDFVAKNSKDEKKIEDHFNNFFQEIIKEKSADEAQNLRLNLRDYHTFLKDLTPLWFKGTLGDVLKTVDQKYYPDINRQEFFQKLSKGIEALEEKKVKDVLDNNKNFMLLIEPDFEEKLFSDINAFLNQFDRCKKKLLEVLKLLENPNIDIEGKLNNYTYKGNPPDKYEFLERKRKPQESEGTDEVSLSVPPWEGRWDTMKPPIVSKREEEGEGKEVEVVEFLVEHRNN